MPVYIYMVAACLLLAVGGFFGLLTIVAMIFTFSRHGDELLLKGMMVCLFFSVVAMYASAAMWPA